MATNYTDLDSDLVHLRQFREQELNGSLSEQDRPVASDIKRRLIAKCQQLMAQRVLSEQDEVALTRIQAGLAELDSPLYRHRYKILSGGLVVGATLAGGTLALGALATVGAAVWLTKKGLESCLHQRPAPSQAPEMAAAASASSSSSAATAAAAPSSSLPRTETSPVGIQNPGNACYVISWLQTFFMTNPTERETLCRLYPNEFGEFWRLYQEAHQHGGTVPGGIIHQIRCLFPDFDNYGQQDVYAFHQAVMDRIHPDLRQYPYHLTIHKVWVPDDHLRYQIRDQRDFETSETNPDLGEIQATFQAGQNLQAIIIDHLSCNVDIDPATRTKRVMQDGQLHEVHELSTGRKWDRAPERLRIQLKRFVPEEEKEEYMTVMRQVGGVMQPVQVRKPPTIVKKQGTIQIPDTDQTPIKIPGQFFEDGHAHHYKLLWCIEHLGATIRGGHYIGYKNTDHCYSMSDDNCQSLSKEEFDSQAQKGYFLELVKID